MSSSSAPLRPTRRDFLRASATGAVALGASPLAYTQGSDSLKVGLIGCGGRGRGAAKDSVRSSEGITIHALGDLFEDRLKAAQDDFSKNVGAAYQVTPERSFVGWDAFQKVLATDVDLVILATPPGFRPQHLEAAIAAGKHVFTEKPVAVDANGVRTVIEAAKAAKMKGLGLVAGTQRRHDFGYNATMKRIHEGAIGEIVAAQCYWNQGGLWSKARKAEWSDMEWQLRNWLYFTWLSGDHIVEQHIHNLDVVRWAIGANPEKAIGMGGREVRVDNQFGHIFDHFAVEYHFPGGVRAHSFCRQIDNCANNVSERIVGTRGVSNPSGSIRGENNWRYKGEKPSAYVQEHADLVASIRAGEPLNEGKQVAESTLIAIMGRMSTYTGKAVTWEQAMNSELDLRPARYAFGEIEVPSVAIPGKTKVI